MLRATKMVSCITLEANCQVRQVAKLMDYLFASLPPLSLSLHLSRRQLGCTVTAAFADRDLAQRHLDAVDLAAARVFASARTHHLQVSGLFSPYELNVPY